MNASDILDSPACPSHQSRPTLYINSNLETQLEKSLGGDRDRIEEEKPSQAVENTETGILGQV